MSKVYFVRNPSAFAELMKCPEMQDILRDTAETVRGRCGDGYEVSVYIGENRANASVVAETPEAKQDNWNNNTLLKALGGVK